MNIKLKHEQHVNDFINAMVAYSPSSYSNLLIYRRNNVTYTRYTSLHDVARYSRALYINKDDYGHRSAHRFVKRIK